MSALRPWVGVATGPATRAAYVEGTRRLLATVEPTLRAFTSVAPLEPAAAAAQTAQAGLGSGPLAGMPVAVKEIIDVAGMEVAFGSAVHAGRVPTRDAEAVARLRAAGAEVVGVTTSTPYACGTTTVTANPHRHQATPGGSSAGSGAAVGAGLVPVALATQSQASTIRPASYCGAWGYKPSHGRLPRGGVRLLSDTLDNLGVIAASLADLEATLAVLADDWTPAPVPGRLRVGVVRLDDGGLPRPESCRALAALVTRLEARSDVRVVRGTPALAAYDALVAGSGSDCFAIFAGEAAPGLAREVAAGETDPRLPEMVEHAARVGTDGLTDALARRRALREAHARLLTTEVDVLLTLATTNPAPDGHDTTGCRRMPATASLLGVPALSAPWLVVDGMPLGVQLLGAEGADERLLAAARHLAPSAPAPAPAPAPVSVSVSRPEEDLP